MNEKTLPARFKRALELENKYPGNGVISLAVNCSPQELELLEAAIPDQAHGGLPTARYIVSKAIERRSINAEDGTD